MLLVMTPPEHQNHPHYHALSASRRVQLGWERADFLVATKGRLVSAAEKEAKLRELALSGVEIIATVVSLNSPFRLYVKQIKA